MNNGLNLFARLSVLEDQNWKLNNVLCVQTRYNAHIEKNRWKMKDFLHEKLLAVKSKSYFDLKNDPEHSIFLLIDERINRQIVS